MSVDITMNKRNVKEKLKNVSSFTLGIAQVVVDGLSSARQIVDFTSAPWAKYAACTASVVEGEIYRKNIFEGLGLINLLTKKGLWNYLIIQALEAELNFIEKAEKEIKAKLYDFFIEIKEDKICKLNTQEQSALKNINLFNDKEDVLREQDVASLFSYFQAIKKDRDETSKFISFKIIDQFKNLKDEFKEFQIRKKEINCAFFISYKANKAILQKAELLDLEASEIEKAEKRLKVLQKSLVERISYPEKWLFIPGKDVNSEIDEPKEKEIDGFIEINKFTQEKVPLTETINPVLLLRLQKKLSVGKARLWPLRFSMLFSMSAGVALGLVTFYTFPVVLTGLGLSLSLTALSAIMWPLAILAAISYGILIYNTMADLIINETLSKWWKALNKKIEQKHGHPHLFEYIFLVITKACSQFFIKLIQWFKIKPAENKFAYSLRILLSLLMIGFTLMAALTVGYTAFIQLQSYVNVVVCVISALPLMISDLIFTLKNSFDSIALLSGIRFANLLDPVKAGWEKLYAQFKRENYLQLTLHLFRLPLSLLLSVFKLSIFLLHIFFVSVASDRLFNLPCWLTLMFTAGSELLTDICPIFGKKGTEGNHDHGGVFSGIGKIIFFIPATLLGLLNCLFSQLNRFSTNSELKVMSWKGAILQEWHQFDILHFHGEKEHSKQTIDIGREVPLPNQIVLQKVTKICDKQINRLDHGFFNLKLAQEKKKAFEECKERVVSAYQEGTSASSISIKIGTDRLLSKHRFFNRTTQTESTRQLKKIQYWLSLDKVGDNSDNEQHLIRSV